ncbi:MAG: hypothetical protein KDC12_07030 [Flavobacteriales bacterium]|nr:hypothetical protein [Flavobacteriales bacterium]
MRNQKMIADKRPYSRLIALGTLALLLISCNPEEHTSVARQVAPTYETEVIKHPSWSVDVVCANTTWNIIREALRNTTARNVWKATRDAGIDVLIVDLPVSKYDDGALKSHLPTERFMPLSADSIQSIISDAKGQGVSFILNWNWAQLHPDDPWVKSCAECFTVTESQVTPNTGDALFNTTQQEALQWWIDSCGFSGYIAHQSGDQPLIVWEQVLESMGKSRKLLCFTDNMDPAVHSVAFHASRMEAFESLFARENLRVSKARAEEIIRNENERYLPTAFRSMELSGNPDSLDAAQLGPLRTAFAFTFKGVPIVDSLHWNVDTAGVASVAFAKWINAPLVRNLARYRHQNACLNNGLAGGDLQTVNTESLALVAYKRTKEDDAVITFINYSELPIRIEVSDPVKGEYLSIGKEQIIFSQHTNGTVVIPPYSFWIFEKQKPRFTP